jgi:cell filamentation protein
MDEWDAYFWPNSDVLKNRVGITNEEALRSFEHEASRRRTIELRARPVQGNFDTAHFREIHRRLFIDVYEWAGRYRTVDMMKGQTGFAPIATKTHTLETWGEKILSDLKAENHLKGLKTAAFVDRLTHHYGEINYWHPHRDGNGRATKEFLAQLGKEAGYQIEFHRVSAKAWNAAAAQHASGDPRMAREVFEKITMPSRAIVFRDEHIFAAKRFPELQGAVNALYAARRKAEAEFNAADQRLFIAKVHAKLLERLRAGDIFNAREVDPPIRDLQPGQTRGGR